MSSASEPGSGRVWRARAAVLLLALAGLLPALSLTMQLAQDGWPSSQGDDLARFDARLAPLREILRGQSRVGYLPPGGSLDVPGGAAHFYMTRWALAPVVVVNEQTEPFVVADGVTDRGQLPGGLVVAHEFGGGLLLLRPREQ